MNYVYINIPGYFKWRALFIQCTHDQTGRKPYRMPAICDEGQGRNKSVFNAKFDESYVV